MIEDQIKGLDKRIEELSKQKVINTFDLFLIKHYKREINRLNGSSDNNRGLRLDNDKDA